MPEHRIRLRGPWDRILAADVAGRLARVDLPLGGVDARLGPFRLIRKFGRPPFDPATETLRLDLAGVPGLVSATLNGSALPMADLDRGALSIPIPGSIPARNILALDVDPALAEGFGGAWGSIALVIGPIPGSSTTRPPGDGGEVRARGAGWGR